MRRSWVALALIACTRKAPAPVVEAGVVEPVVTHVAPQPIIASVDRAVDEAIVRGDVRGAVVVVWARDRLIHRKAYGDRRVTPERVPMTVDTIFDLASLTKPLATAMSIHRLASEKKLALTDSAKKYVPELADERITIEHLLLHTSGLPPACIVFPTEAETLKKIGTLENKTFGAYRYSDVGFMLLGAIVARVSGERLDSYASRTFYAPLGLDDTRFLPLLSARIAPTNRDHVLIDGVVHDPRASTLGGVAGHAGLFSTADDVAAIGRMLLHRGELNGVRVLPDSTVSAMTAHHGTRTLGWDIHGNGFGHTGFTGTSIYVDPAAQSVVVILTSRLHPDEKGDVTRLRREVDDAARTVIGAPVVLSGIDVLERDGFARFHGKKVALLTNRSAVDRGGRRTIDVLRANGVNVVVLLTPEHGIDATADALVADSIDAATQIPIKSLYGAQKKVGDLLGADTIVFDLQDAGARFYTYETTLGYVLEKGVPVVVLDRPNPVGGAIEGPLLDENRKSFTGYDRTPIRHGMTLGELAQMYNAKLGTPLSVVKMIGYRRDMTFAQTGLPWVPPSPNLRTEVEALLYPGVALVEGTNVSVGRGTSTPFEVIGAPFIDGAALAKRLNARELGVTFEATRFTPTSSTHAGIECGGVRLVAEKPFDSVRLGVAIALDLKALYPDAWQSKNLLAIVGNAATVAAIERGDALDAIVASWKSDEAAFAARRKPFLLY